MIEKISDLITDHTGQKIKESVIGQYHAQCIGCHIHVWFDTIRSGKSYLQKSLK